MCKSPSKVTDEPGWTDPSICKSSPLEKDLVISVCLCPGQFSVITDAQ